ncbi:lipase family protein [Streptomyces sp. NPDC054796]
MTANAQEAPRANASDATGAADTTSAATAAQSCEASDDQIYTPPQNVPGTPGEVISCRQVTLPHVPGNIDMTAWKVQYASKDNAGRPVAVSGTVAVPRAAWKGPGTRPVVAFNPGTLGLGQQCAFSKQLAGQFQDMYEGDNIAASLKAGYAVAATDGAGYLKGRTHPYVAGTDAGHALLDIARAAPNVPGSGLDKKTKVGLWGYSEGGSASLWAVQLAKAYAPELNIVGDASGGVPGDLKVVAKALNGQAFAGFLADAVIGLAAAYPAMPFDGLLNQQGRDAVAKAKSVCLVGTLTGFPFQKLENFTTEGYTLDEIYALKGTDGKTWGEVVDAQKLGVGVGPAGSGAKHEIGFPVLQYRGLADEVIPTETEDATRAAYCQAKIPTTWKLYPGEHLLADNQAVNDVVAWLGDRFAGKTAPDDC